MTDALKDFDSERPVPRDQLAGFRLGGVEFHIRTAVKPETLSEFRRLPDDATLEAELGMLDHTIKAFLPDSEHERWDELRARKDAPVTLQELYAVIRWASEVNADRPTPASTDSSTSRTADATTSADASPSPEETPTE